VSTKRQCEKNTSPLLGGLRNIFHFRCAGSSQSVHAVVVTSCMSSSWRIGRKLQTEADGRPVETVRPRWLRRWIPSEKQPAVGQIGTLTRVQAGPTMNALIPRTRSEQNWNFPRLQANQSHTSRTGLTNVRPFQGARSALVKPPCGLRIQGALYSTSTQKLYRMPSCTMNDCPFWDVSGPHFAKRDQFGRATCPNWFGNSGHTAP
jgi:hypothetical protein